MGRKLELQHLNKTKGDKVRAKLKNIHKTFKREREKRKLTITQMSNLTGIPRIHPSCVGKLSSQSGLFKVL